ncbi:DUF4396 domain-containing protein [Alicyclobacillus sp. SO9]|nr:DUF4396 domain-containing protein [Alicyclobacillus sp. SO9]
MGIAGLYAYWNFGRNTPMMHHGQESRRHGHHDAHHEPSESMHHHRSVDTRTNNVNLGGQRNHHAQDSHSSKPFWQSVFVSSTHCGGGCTLGDAIGGPLVFSLGLVVAGSSLFADYIVEFLLAYIFGIAFQYFGMGFSNLESLAKGLKNAVKADTFSLTAYEVGMFGWMALVHVFFVPIPQPNHLLYWFMMQVAMMIGFLTSYPANWVLVRMGIKHAM